VGSDVREVGVVLVGAGPAGSALLRAALRSGRLDDLARAGIAIVDQSPIQTLGAGRIGEYLVRSDTRAGVFLECLEPMLEFATREQRSRLEGILDGLDPESPVPLDRAARVLAAASKLSFAEIVRRLGPVLVSARVTSVGAHDGGWLVQTADGGPTLIASCVVVATGGAPWTPADLSSRGLSQLVHSDSLLRGAGPHLERADGNGATAVIIGGSHSAFSSALRLLSLDADHVFEHSPILIVHRRPIRVTFDNAEAAHAESYRFGPDDVCPLTGRVHRLGGLRTDSADLWRRIVRDEEHRVRLIRTDKDPATEAVVQDAALVVAATGYRSCAGSLFAPDVEGMWFDLTGQACSVGGDALHGVFGLGLGTGRTRDDLTGGEPSFSGAIDGAWFYENVVAPPLLERIVNTVGAA
jgi:hypothetical protein